MQTCPYVECVTLLFGYVRYLLAAPFADAPLLPVSFKTALTALGDVPASSGKGSCRSLFASVACPDPYLLSLVGVVRHQTKKRKITTDGAGNNR